MDSLSEIKEKIRSIAGKNKQTVMTVKVTKTQGEICSVDLDGLELSDVRLRSVINSERSKLVVTPKVGSYITIADISGDLTELVMLQASEVDKVELTCEGDVIINGGNNDGLVMINELTEKLNGLKDTVNEIVNAFNSHQHTVETSGSATAQMGTAAPVTSQVMQAKAFDKSDYENTRIKQ